MRTMRPSWIGVLIAGWLLCLAVTFPATSAQAVDTAPYFPLHSGNWWQYLENGADTYTQTVLAGTATVNSIPTKIMEGSDGLQEYFTNDSNGIRLHRLFFPDLQMQGQDPVDVTVTFSPPVVFASPIMDIGTTINGTGSAALQVQNIPGQSSLNYTASSTLQAVESITVPYGQFQTIKGLISIRIYGSVGGQSVDTTITLTLWLAKYWGTVQQILEANSETSTRVLTDTNLTGAPLPPEAAFQAQVLSGVAPLTVNFTDRSTGEISSWAWDFGDTQSSTEQNPSHTYPDPGTYTVALTVTGPGGSDTETKTNYITVNNSPPSADFTADPTQGLAPLTVNFTDQSTGEISSWAWDFGDTQSSTEQNPSHTYTEPGIYSVSLTVTDGGTSSSKTMENYISVSQRELLILAPVRSLLLDD